jgi:hypothetical protein
VQSHLVAFKLTISEVPNIWVRPNNQRREADAAKALLTVPDGDHLTLLNVYNNYEQSKRFLKVLLGVFVADVTSRRQIRQKLDEVKLCVWASARSGGERPRTITANNGAIRIRIGDYGRHSKAVQERPDSTGVRVLYAGCPPGRRERKLSNRER